MIERFVWTDHAERRLEQRGISREEVEMAVVMGEGQLNLGDADWRVTGVRSDGRGFVVLYDWPVLGDPGTARIVTVWTLGSGRIGIYPWLR